MRVNKGENFCKHQKYSRPRQEHVECAGATKVEMFLQEWNENFILSFYYMCYWAKLPHRQSRKIDVSPAVPRLSKVI